MIKHGKILYNAIKSNKIDNLKCMLYRYNKYELYIQLQMIKLSL